jgi:hypothetical protein
VSPCVPLCPLWLMLFLKLEVLSVPVD